MIFLNSWLKTTCRDHSKMSLATDIQFNSQCVCGLKQYSSHNLIVYIEKKEERTPNYHVKRQDSGHLS